MTTLGRSEKTSQLFVEFQYGDPADPSFARFTDWTEDTIFGAMSATFNSEPRMEIAAPEISGVLADKTLRVQLPLVEDGFTGLVSNGEPHSPIKVTFWELLKSADGLSPSQTLVLFRGIVSRVVRNYQGRTGDVLIEARDLKTRFDVPMGMTANHQCIWTLGERGCGVTVTTSTGTLTAINGKTVTITGLSAQADRFWHRGYVEFDGLRILIRDWVSGTSFQLVREPPASWEGETVKVYGGCDKTIETCRARWSNEANFGGFGYAIPAYSPNYEVL